jgi:hypothetical protein
MAYVLGSVNSAKNYLLVLLFLTTVGSSYLAWRQYQELIGLRASALDREERAALQKRIWAAESRTAALEKKLTAPKPAGDDAGETDPAPPASDPRRARGGGFLAMMENPEMQKLMHVQQKASLDGRYAALFKSLNLTPEQLEKFKNLLVERQTAMMDVFAAAREQGINPRTDPEAFQKLIADAQAEIDASIEATLGEVGYTQYKSYEEAMPQRNTVSQLGQRLSYSTTPLSDSQSEQLVSILATTGTTSGNQRGSMFGGPGQGTTTLITDATIAQAQGVLAGAQLEALEQLQQEQQAQAQLQQEMRRQFQSGGTPPPPPGAEPGGG